MENGRILWASQLHARDSPKFLDWEKEKDKMAITVYTMPDCSQCDTTKAFLNKHNLTFTAVDIIENPGDYQTIKSMGYNRVPVVVTDSDHWQGFRPDKLFDLARG